MKLIAVAVSLALFSSFGVQSNSEHQHGGVKATNAKHLAPLMEVVKQSPNLEKTIHRTSTEFIYEPDLAPGTYTYIIELRAPSVTERPELLRSLNETKSGARKNSMPDSINKHLNYLDSYQQSFLSELSRIVKNTKPLAQYRYALNAVALEMTQEQAVLLTNNPQVKKISRERIHRIETDRGPTLVGAPNVWNASIGSLPQTQGEGVVIGIIDSGVNTDHPSFAEVSGDGYTHTNPLGNGVFIGDCAVNFPELCNNKLIGVRSYSVITRNYSDIDVFPPSLPENGEDYGGHGSHVASTAAGNILLNLPETLPTAGEIVSDGTATGFTFPQVSGVAPRANIISYQVCYGGRSDQNDTYADCPGSAILLGIDDAIADGVDVINFSISGGGNPWSDTTERAFLSAQQAGIFVATSAGNSGANPSTSVKHSPWYSSVAASEHGRQNAFVKQLDNFTGGNSTPAAITGQSDSGSISASIVYAGDFNNPNDPNNDSAQCLQPFPSNTFNGQIVVCDRGEIARLEKAINAQAGGAGGFVLANVQGGDTFLADDRYVIPGIQINADDGDRLKLWLASGANHTASISTGVASQNIDVARVDVLGNFSSRGPNTTISTLNPTMTAPGVDIYAAYADERYGHDGHVAPAGDFSYLSGTSMSSPHVAGAAALLRAVHPSWTPDNIRSALALTANTGVLREDATTEADPFDMGSGRIQVDAAAQTGLIMGESFADYLAANPAAGGDPRSLNLPSITDNECLGVCTWTRTFTATKDGSWDVRGDALNSSLNISVSPETFTLQAGESQAIEVSIDSIDADKNIYVFGQVVLTAANSPELRLPVSVFSTLGDIPTDIAAAASRDGDSFLIDDIEAIDLNSFVLTPYSLVKASSVVDVITQDSDTSDYLDDLTDGVVITEINVPLNAKRLVTEIVSSSAPDLDLFLIFDANNDGVLSSFEEIGASLSFDALEEITVNNPDAGRYFIVVQSFTGSTQDNDDFEMRYAVVTDDEDDSLSASAPTSLSADVPFDLRVFYQLSDANVGDDFYGAIDLGRSANNPSNLGMITVDIVRNANDVVITGTEARVSPGDQAQLEVIVLGNTTNEARTYQIEIPVPDGVTFTNVDATVNGEFDGQTLSYQVNKAVNDFASTSIIFDMLVEEVSTPGPIIVNMQSELMASENSQVMQAPPYTDIQIEGAPALSFNGTDTTTLNIFETQTLVVPITVNDPNDDAVSLSYSQTQGPTTAITQTDGVSSLIAPSVEATTVLSYEVTGDDGRGNQSTAVFSVNVVNNEEPVINSISAPASVNRGQRVTITVTTSDPENDPLTVTINGSSGSSVTITTPSSGTSVSYTVEVSDGINTVSEVVNITLTQAPAPPANNDGGGGGSMPLWCLLLMLGTAHWRYRGSLSKRS